MPQRVRYARRTSATVIQGKESEFLSLMKKTVYPKLAKEKGLRRIYLLRDVKKPNEFFSLTLWNSKREADSYGSGRFADYAAIVAERLEKNLAVDEFKVEYHAVNPSIPPPRRAQRSTRGSTTKARGQ